MNKKTKQIILWIIAIASAIALALGSIIDNLPTEQTTKPDTTIIINPNI